MADTKARYGKAGDLEPFGIIECGPVVIGRTVAERRQFVLPGPDRDVGDPQASSGRWTGSREFVVFLLSERSGVVTGSVIDWDQNVLGGMD